MFSTVEKQSKMDAGQDTIWWAFKQMGIPVSASSDHAIPLGNFVTIFTWVEMQGQTFS
jgi:hypothetical protein